MDSTTLSLLEASGLALFVWYLFRGLSQQISSLKELVSTQKQTIEVMERRISETEKIGGIYKNLLSDLPKDLEDYKRIVSITKDTTITELQTKHAAAERRLEDVTAELKRAGHTATQVSAQLAGLRVLMTGRTKINDTEEEFNLKRIAEVTFDFVDQAMVAISQCNTVEDFLRTAAKDLIVTEDETVLEGGFRHGVLMDGTPVKYSYSLNSYGKRTHWFILTPRALFTSPGTLAGLANEFAAVKNAA